MDAGIRQITVGRHQIGMRNLDDLFRKVRAKEYTDPEEIRMALLTGAKTCNHIPDQATDEYRAALYREYRRFCGDDIASAATVALIRVLGPGCARCDELMRRLRTVLAERGIVADLEHVRDLSAIAAYGLHPTPVLVIGDCIVSAGKVPTRETLVELLDRHLPTGAFPESS